MELSKEKAKEMIEMMHFYHLHGIISDKQKEIIWNKLFTFIYMHGWVVKDAGYYKYEFEEVRPIKIK